MSQCQCNAYALVEGQTVDGVQLPLSDPPTNPASAVPVEEQGQRPPGSKSCDVPGACPCEDDDDCEDGSENSGDDAVWGG